MCSNDSFNGSLVDGGSSCGGVGSCVELKTYDDGNTKPLVGGIGGDGFLATANVKCINGI